MLFNLKKIKNVVYLHLKFRAEEEARAAKKSKKVFYWLSQSFSFLLNCFP